MAITAVGVLVALSGFVVTVVRARTLVGGVPMKRSDAGVAVMILGIVVAIFGLGLAAFLLLGPA